MALGRGLKSLIPENDLLFEDETKVLEFVNPKDVVPNPNQVRKVFDEQKIEELANSINTFGVLEPIIIKRDKDKYIIIAGERRWRAASKLGLDQIPAIITNEPENYLELSIIENLQREDLSPVELAQGYAELIDSYDYTHEKLAERFGISRSGITNILRLLKLPEEIQDLVNENKLSYATARLLLGIKEPELQLKIANKAVEEDMSVRGVENLIKELKPRTRKKREVKKDPYIEDIQDYLCNYFDTKVNIKENKNNKGKIEINFDSFKDSRLC